MGAGDRTQVLPQELVTSESSLQSHNPHTSKIGADEKTRGKKDIENRGFLRFLILRLSQERPKGLDRNKSGHLGDDFPHKLSRLVVSLHRAISSNGLNHFQREPRAEPLSHFPTQRTRWGQDSVLHGGTRQ